MGYDRNHRRRTFISALRSALLVFLFLASAVVVLFLSFYKTDRDALIAKVQADEISSVNMQFQAVTESLRHAFEDLYFLSKENELMEFLDTGDRTLIPRMWSEYISLSRSSGLYDQIRFIGRSGMEIVRVNRNNGCPSAVPEKDLQNKGDRYYFTEAFSKNRDEVFISPFDLNIEGGEIEIPLKPMIRIATPVFSSDAEKKGIVVINYLGQEILNQITEHNTRYPETSMLLNSDGFWLLSPSSEKNWGFMYGDEKRRFSHEYKEEWKRLADSESGQFLTGKGLFTFARIYPAGGADRNDRGDLVLFRNMDQKDQFWILLSVYPEHLISARNREILTKYLRVLIVFFVLVVCLSCSRFFILKKRLDHVEQLRSMALFDTLTGLPNRVLLFDRLATAIEETKRYGHIGALLFVDLDGFKPVNDSYGHEMGDILLREVGEQLTKCCRKTDTVSRIGGDEFAVVAGYLGSAEDAGIVAGKIITAISGDLHLDVGNIQIGASIGISIFPDDSDNGDELLALADNAMYKSKRNGKNRYTYHLAGT